jgi:SAM-dependent methyltransferase
MKQFGSQKGWDKEYSDPQFTSFERVPHQGVKDFLSFLRRKQKIELEDKTLFDVGCGIGKDLEYAAFHYGMNVSGCDVSPIAIKEAQTHVPDARLFVHDLEKPLPIETEIADVVLLVMVFHTLSREGRKLCLSEINRVLQPGGFFYMKTPILSGDKHAKYLIEQFPGTEQSSFIHPELGMPEYVYPEKELVQKLSEFFEIISFKKTSGYQKWNNQPYKRKYAEIYLKK